MLFRFVRKVASNDRRENLKGIMNPRSTDSFVRSVFLLVLLKVSHTDGHGGREGWGREKGKGRDREKRGVWSRSLKLFLATEETSIILVVYAHVGAQLADRSFLHLVLLILIGGTGQRQ